MKRIGTYNGFPLYEDPACPPNTLYFLNEEFYTLSCLSRWERVKARLRQLISWLGDHV